MLWPPWETVPECSPQIQAWDYLGGYYIRCRGNFRDSRISEPLGFGWTRLLACHCLRRVHLYTETPVRASPSGPEFPENQRAAPLPVQPRSVRSLCHSEEGASALTASAASTRRRILLAEMHHP